MEFITNSYRSGSALDSGQPPYTFSDIASQQPFSPHDQSGWLYTSALSSISSSPQFNSASQFGVLNDDCESLGTNFFNGIGVTSTYPIPGAPPVCVDESTSLYTDFLNDIRVLPSIINDGSHSSMDPKDIMSFLPMHQTDVANRLDFASEPLNTDYLDGFKYQPDAACERSAEPLPQHAHQTPGRDGMAHRSGRSTRTGVLCCGSGCRGNLM